MAAPILKAEVEINAPVSTVWSLVSDVTRMPQWSPQCRVMKALGPIRPGTRTININRRGMLFWPTTSVITEVVPERKSAFRIPINTTVWSYELEPTATGTRLTETIRIRAPRMLLAVPVRQAVAAHREMLAGIRRHFEG